MSARIPPSVQAAASGSRTADTDTPSGQAPRPLNSRKLAQMPGLKTVQAGDELRVTSLRGMKFIENPRLPGEFKTIDFINQVAERVNAMLVDRPITLISLGAGLLLLEHLIHAQLSEEHQKATRWRVIDPDYSPSIAAFANRKGVFKELETARIEFGRQKSARPFSTSSAYLAKVENGQKMSELDKTQGPVMIMSANPPTIKMSPEERRNIENDTLLIRGFAIPSAELQKANVVLLSYQQRKKSGAASAENVGESLKGGKALIIDAVMKCFVDTSGEFRFEPSPHEPSKKLFEAAEITIQRSKGLPGNQGATPFENLLKSAHGFVNYYHRKQQHSEMSISVISDYDRSMSELQEHFSSSKRDVVFASLKDNQVELKDIVKQK
jgi:hypothetical protein